MQQILLCLLLIFTLTACESESKSAKSVVDTSPIFQVVPEKINFESVYVGEKSANKLITIKNNGVATLSFSAGLNLPEGFFVDNDESTCEKQLQKLAYGQSCSFSIYFIPKSVKRYNDNITISQVDTLIDTKIKITLSGIGATFNKDTMLDGVNFGIVTIGSNALGKARIRNIAGKDINLSTPIINEKDGFEILTTDCKDKLPANRSCTIDVKFEPFTQKLYKNYISITIDERPIALPLTGSTNKNILLKPKINAREGHSSVTYKDRIYYFGGTNKISTKGADGVLKTEKIFYDDLWLYGKDGYWQEITTADLKKPEGRAFHASANIEDKVYIFGGVKLKDNNLKPMNDLWWYDITQKRWVSPTITSPMPEVFGHSADNINSKIYIFGGFDNQTAYNDLWVFDADKENFTKVILSNSETVPTARYNHSTTVINDKLYIIGGLSDKSKLIDNSSIYIFDPNKQSWSVLENATTGTQNSNRYGTSSVAINKSLFIFGGRDDKTFLGDFHKYDSSSRAWQELSKLTVVKPSARDNSSLKAIGENLYLFAGFDIDGAQSDMWIFDQWKQSWQETEDTRNNRPFFRYGGSSVEINGKIYLFGGKSDTPPKTYNDMWQYDIAGGSWGRLISQSNPTPTPRYYHSVSLIDDKIYIFGGIDQSSNVLDEVWEFDPIEIKWSKKTPPTGIVKQTARRNHTATTIGKKLYIYGGVNSLSSILNDLIIYDSLNPTITIPNIASEKPEGRYGHSAVSIGDNIYVFGGRTLNSKFTNELWRFNTTNDSWTNLTINPPLSARYQHNAVAIGNIIYILGGEDGNSTDALNDIWAYNTLTNTWSEVHPQGSTAVIGNRSTSTVFESGIYIYNMITRTFSIVYN